MADSDKEISIIDLIEYYEPGPVLKQRTPDLNRTSFHSGDGEHLELDNPPEPGKNLTSSIRRRRLNKKALGLTGVPIHGTPGNTGAFRQRDEYNEEDFEAQFGTGFGGPSELDNFLEKEDKPPTNISRKLNTDKKIKTLGDLDKMSFQKSELLKLAKALRHRGQDSFAHRVEAVALRKVSADETADRKSVYDALTELRSGRWYPMDESARLPWSEKQVNKPDSNSVEKTYQGLIDYWNDQDLSAGGGGEPNDDDKKRNAEFLGNFKYKELTLDPFIQTMWSDGKGGYATSGTGDYSWLSPFENMNSFKEAVSSEVEEFIKIWNAVSQYASTHISRAGGGSGGTAPSAGGAAPATSGGGASTTQQKTWGDVQTRLNELYGKGGALESRVSNGVITGTDPAVRILLDVDYRVGPQTRGAFTDATGRPLTGLTPVQALNALEGIGKKEETDTPKQGPKASEPDGEKKEADSEAILRGARLNTVANLNNWYTAPADDGNTLVAIRKSDGQLAALSTMKFKVVKNEEGGHTLTQSEDGQQVWTDMQNRGEDGQILFQSGSDYLSGGEQTRLMKVIRDAEQDKEKEKTYKDIIVGQRRGERGGFLNQKGVKRRGRRREEAARGRLRGRDK